MTDIEELTSGILTDLGYRFYFQYELFPYIVDFYIPEFKIVVESDGNIWHNDMADRERDLVLMEKYKVRVMHYTDSQIKKYPKEVGKGIADEIERTTYKGLGNDGEVLW